MSNSPSKKAWSSEEDTALARSILQILFQNRSEVYSAPGLEDFTGHGASKINNKLQQWLSRNCGADLVKEEIEKTKGNRGGAGKGGSPGKKVTPKKRKVVKEEEESE